MSTDSKIERPLPHSTETERVVLASIFLDSPGVREAMVQLEPDDFFLSQNRVIYRCIKHLVEQGKPPESLLVLESLASSGEIETAGGAAYLSQIPDGMPRISNLRFYVEILREKTQLRKYAYTAQAIMEMALGANGDAAAVLERIANLSAQLREEVGQKRILTFRSGAEIAMLTDEGIQWIAQGLVAKGAITELGAKVKTGKTTFILSLVRAAADGTAFLGKCTLKTPTVYLTEQPVVSFRQAMQRADLLGREDFHILFHSDVRGTPWQGIAAAAANECRRVGAGLLVVDTLPQFAGLKGDSENNSGDALAAMEPLQKAAADGTGIILVRHERKSGGDVGDSGRGSSAFAGAVDIVLSLRKREGNSKKTHRVLQALSRFSETPPELLLDFLDNGYNSLGSPHDAAVMEAKDSIITLAPKSEAEALDLKELAEIAKVPRSTAQRAVEELLEEGALEKVGEGKRGRPFRYYKTGNRFGPTSDIGGQKETAEERDPHS